VECVIEIPSFIHVNVSGGDPDEVQVNVKGEPITTSLLDNDGYTVITGEAEHMYENITNNQLS